MPGTSSKNCWSFFQHSLRQQYSFVSGRHGGRVTFNKGEALLQKGLQCLCFVGYSTILCRRLWSFSCWPLRSRLVGKIRRNAQKVSAESYGGLCCLFFPWDGLAWCSVYCDMCATTIMKSSICSKTCPMFGHFSRRCLRRCEFSKRYCIGWRICFAVRTKFCKQSATAEPACQLGLPGSSSQERASLSACSWNWISHRLFMRCKSTIFLYGSIGEAFSTIKFVARERCINYVESRPYEFCYNCTSYSQHQALTILAET